VPGAAAPPRPPAGGAPPSRRRLGRLPLDDGDPLFHLRARRRDTLRLRAHRPEALGGRRGLDRRRDARLFRPGVVLPPPSERRLPAGETGPLFRDGFARRPEALAERLQLAGDGPALARPAAPPARAPPPASSAAPWGSPVIRSRPPSSRSRSFSAATMSTRRPCSRSSTAAPAAVMSAIRARVDDSADSACPSRSA